jgi:hypothetical protein
MAVAIEPVGGRIEHDHSVAATVRRRRHGVAFLPVGIGQQHDASGQRPYRGAFGSEQVNRILVRGAMPPALGSRSVGQRDRRHEFARELPHVSIVGGMQQLDEPGLSVRTERCQNAGAYAGRGIGIRLVLREGSEQAVMIVDRRDQERAAQHIAGVQVLHQEGGILHFVLYP